MSSLTITLPDVLRDFAEAEATAKGFPDAAAYVRSLLDVARESAEDSRIEDLLLQGLDSPAIEVTGSFWSDLEAEAAVIRALGKDSTRR